MDLTEPPSLAPEDETVLEVGMVITLEPSLALPGAAGLTRRLMVHEERHERVQLQRREGGERGEILAFQDRGAVELGEKPQRRAPLLGGPGAPGRLQGIGGHGGRGARHRGG